MASPVIDQDTDSFNIQVKDPEITRDDEVRAEVIAKPLDERGEGYPEKIKLKTRAMSEYANNIQDMFNLSSDQQEELKTEIMRLKNDVRRKARQLEYEDEEGDVEDRFCEMLHMIENAGGVLEVEAVESEFENYMELIDSVDSQQDYVMSYQGVLDVTDEGTQKVRDWLGFEVFEGDVEAEAEKQLADNPLGYYLDSFNKVHKGDHLLKIWELVSALSSTCSDLQIHSWAVGPSGKGKSHIKRKLLDFLPEEAYEKKNSMSPKAMLYKSQQEGTDFLNEQLVFFDEAEDLEEVVTLLRSLTDQDEDRIEHTTVKDQQPETMVLESDQITVWFTSVETIQDEQLKNRFILTNPDSSADLDDKVFEHQQGLLHYGDDLDFIPKEAPVIQRMIRNIREDTPELTPIVPFEVEWKQKFNRRLYPYFYTLMGLLAKIHYKNREVVNGNIIVTRADFQLASLIWSRLIDTTVAQQDEDSIRLLKHLPDNQNDALNTTEISQRLSGFSPNKVRRKATALEESAEELTLIQSEKDGSRWTYWAGPDVDKLVDNEPEIQDFSPEVIKEMLSRAEVEATDEVIDSVVNTKIEIYEELQDKFQESRKRRRDLEKDSGLDIDITDDEHFFLEQCHTFDWSTDVNSIQQMNSEEDIDFMDAASSLEEKGVIRIDGDNNPSPTSKLDELQAEGEVSL